MKVVCHQPCYLPWPGFFYKAMRADCIVLLDSVQLPRGTSWVTRNRIKGPVGQAWLTVPVRRKGRGLQVIADVDIFNERSWARAHLKSLIHSYKKSPFFDENMGMLEEAYDDDWQKLADLNIFLIRRLLSTIGVGAEIRLSSDLDVRIKGTPLLVEICRKMNAGTYSTIRTSRKHMEEDRFTQAGIKIDYYTYRCPRYPQLWGEFIPNLSVVDVLFNCGPRTLGIIERGGGKSASE